MSINFNPNRPPNDSLTPREIKNKAISERIELEVKCNKAFIQAGVPVSASAAAAHTLAWKDIDPSEDKAFQDATTWWYAKIRRTK